MTATAVRVRVTVDVHALYPPSLYMTATAVRVRVTVRVTGQDYAVRVRVTVRVTGQDYMGHWTGLEGQSGGES